MTLFWAIFRLEPERFIVSVCGVCPREKQMKTYVASHPYFSLLRSSWVLHCAFGVLMQNLCLAHMCCSEPHTGRVWQGISYWLSAVVLTACPGFTATANRFHELNTLMHSSSGLQTVCFCLAASDTLWSFDQHWLQITCPDDTCGSHLSSWLFLRLFNHLFHVHMCTQDNGSMQYPLFVLAHFMHMASHTCSKRRKSNYYTLGCLITGLLKSLYALASKFIW